jgi:hypothetical protein
MTNPYQPPTHDGMLRIDSRETNDSRDKIRKRVARPATALIIMASIQSTFQAIQLVSVVLLEFRFGNAFAFTHWTVLAAIFQFVGLIVIAIGAAKLGFLESYSWARLGSILACVPVVTPFLIVGIPFGIWSLILLADPEVRNAFPDRKSATS